MAEELVRSLARGLEAITAFDADHPALTLSEVAELTGLGLATARRFLLTLVELGYVRSDGRCLSPTPQVLRLGTAYVGALNVSSTSSAATLRGTLGALRATADADLRLVTR